MNFTQFLHKAKRACTMYVFRHPVFTVVYVIMYFLPGVRFGVRFYSEKELINELRSGKSYIRMGDGEIYICNGGDIHYQKYSPSLSKEMQKIISEYKKGSPYILAINEHVMTKSNAYIKKLNQLRCWIPMKAYYFLHFNKRAIYGDASVFYYDGASKRVLPEICAGKHVIVVTRKGSAESIKDSRIKIGLDISYVETPDTQSYEVRDAIARDIFTLINKRGWRKKDVIMLVSMGPATKPFVYKYAQEGWQLIDVGIGIEMLYRSDSLEHMLMPKS